MSQAGPKLTRTDRCHRSRRLSRSAQKLITQPVAPIKRGRFGAVSLRLLGGIGLDLMAAIPAPHDQANTGGSRAA